MSLVTRPVIDVASVTFQYDAEKALDNVSFSLAQGSYTGIIGPNGGGKTTLVKLMLGLLLPQQGTIEIFGKHPRDARKEGGIGYVPQRIVQSDAGCPATVYEVVRSGRIAKAGSGLHYSECDECAVQQAMVDADIRMLKDKTIDALSGGQRQRVFIARALAAEPSLLILDEPTTGVDIHAMESFYDLLEHLNKRHSMTILLVSHDIDAIAREVDAVLCLNHQLVAHCGPRQCTDPETLSALYGPRLTPLRHHGHA